MAFREIARRIRYPVKTSERYKRLDAYDRLRAGTFYDHIKIPFDQEYEGDAYIPLNKRRPSVIWNGADMLAGQISGLLWGDEQMPVVRTYLGESPSDQDKEAETAIQHLSETLGLDAVMDQVTAMASSGSCAVIVRATSEKRPYIDVVPGKECTPKFDPRNPYVMTEFEQLYPTTGAALVEMGYEIDDKDLNEEFWFRLTIDTSEEVWYRPMLAKDYERLGEEDPQTGRRIAWVRDDDNSYEHDWDVVPVLWIKAPARGINKLDGECLYGNVVDALVSVDYDLSQIQRGFRYTADPMLAIRRGELANGATPVSYQASSEDKTKKDETGAVVKSPTNILDIEPGGEAILLEISGQGLDKFREYVKTKREWLLEIAGGMKADSDATKGSDSGRMIEVLYQALILLLKRWRVALGNNGYIPLLRLLLRGLKNGVLEVEGVGSAAVTTVMRLVWQNWMTPTGQDLLATANAWQTLAGGSQREPVVILPRDVVSRLAAGNLGMTDTAAIIDAISDQNTADDAKAKQEADDEAARQQQPPRDAAGA